MTMDEKRRVFAYRKMNGSMRLTPRQLRRIKHKRNHAAAPFGKKAGK